MILSIDTETVDPYLKDRGPSWVFGEGKVLCTAVFCERDGIEVYEGTGGQIIESTLRDERIELVGTNLQYDVLWLCYEFGMKVSEVKCKLIDISIAESIIDPDAPYALEDLALKYLKEHKANQELNKIAAGLSLKGDVRTHLQELWQKGYEDEIMDYCASDAYQPARIWLLQREELNRLGGMEAFTLNMDVQKVCMKMKQHGVRIDYFKWKLHSDKCKDIYKKLWNQFIEKYCDKYNTVNINSGKQLAEKFDKMGIPYSNKITIKGYRTPAKFTKDQLFSGDTLWDELRRIKSIYNSARVEKGRIILVVANRYALRIANEIRESGYEVTCNPVINAKFFQDGKETYPILKDIIEVKQVVNIMTKILGPKFERFFSYTSGDCRLHGDFNPVGARQTSRLSSNSPNMQNLPSKTRLFRGTPDEIDLAKMCREIFLPERGEQFVHLDFANQEGRIQAHFAVGKAGKAIRKMYNDNPMLDTHAYVAEITGLAKEYGPEIGRKYAKNVAFGLAYGMSVATMARNFGWTLEFAQYVYDKVVAATPWVAQTMEYINNLMESGERNYVVSLMGRRMYLPHNSTRESYKMYNKLIQGSAADMTKLAMVAIDKKWPDATILLSVHDENDYSIPCGPTEHEMISGLQYEMEHAAPLSVPVVCQPEVGPTWADCVEYEEDLELDDEEMDDGAGDALSESDD